MPDPTPPKAPRPTAKQLHYLKTLAAQRGQSFTYPHTSAQASREIDRLQRAPRTPRADVARERRQITDDMATKRGDAARVRDDETTGHGSNARWARTERNA
jgi:hypothetical protein